MNLSRRSILAASLVLFTAFLTVSHQERSYSSDYQIEQVYYRQEGRRIEMLPVTDQWVIGLTTAQESEIKQIESELAMLGLSVQTRDINRRLLFLDGRRLDSAELQNVKELPEVRSIRPWYTFPDRYEPVYLSDAIGVVFKETPSEQLLKELSRAHHLEYPATTYDYLPQIVYFTWRGSGISTISEDMSSLSKAESILSVEPDFGSFIRPLGLQPDDPLWGEQWYLHDTHTHFPDAWELAYGATPPLSSISIAIIDTWGPTSIHRYNVTEYYDMVGDDNLRKNVDIDDPQYGLIHHSHASAIMSVINSRTNNDDLLAGAVGGWDGSNRVQIHLVEMIGRNWTTYDTTATGYPSKIVEAFNKVIEWGSHVVNCSWGVKYESGTVNSAITSATSIGGPHGQGAVVVFASGNNHGGTPITPPGTHPKVLTVGSVDYNKVRQDYSQYASDLKDLDLVAPAGLNGGEEPWMPATDQLDYTIVVGARDFPAVRDHIWYKYGGTSLAAPLVASSAALVRFVHPELASYKVRDLLRATAEKIPGGTGYGGNSGTTETYYYGTNGHNEKVGYGMVRPDWAVAEILNLYPPRPTGLTAGTPSTSLDCDEIHCWCYPGEQLMRSAEEPGGGEWKVKLSWQPAEDPYASHQYLIERSPDGVHFGPRYWTDFSPKDCFVDQGLEEGKTYWYRVGEVWADSEHGTRVGPRSTIVEVHVEGIEPLNRESDSTELQFGLAPPIPNPFNREIKIQYALAEYTGDVRVLVLNTRGQIVRTLFQGAASAGTYSVRWDGRNSTGQEVSSGIYLVLLQADARRDLRKITLIK